MRQNTKFIMIFPTFIFALGAALLLGNAVISVSAQQLFASPEDATKELIRATNARDHSALAAVFGPRLRDFVSGDPVSDAAEFEEFAAKISKSVKFEKVADNKLTLLIGADDWPFAAPLINTGKGWRFDTDAGVEEMINRRIGTNEFLAMNLCQAYVVAQFEYFNGEDWDGDQVSEYAQKISSSPARRDGLYWPTAAEEEDESPLGPLFARAALDGYKASKGTIRSAAPFYGYNFKVLFRQGSSAPGGKFEYVINGNMIAGFALVAYPATWGNSGVMTFIVNQEGRVYEKNLGPRTSVIAEAMTVFDPDASWSLANSR